MKNVIRSKDDAHSRILHQGRITTVSSATFFRKNRITKILRLRPPEYYTVGNNTLYITHFNLQYVDHYTGEIFALPLIVKPGYSTDRKEVLPVLDFENCYVGKCIRVKNHVPYDHLTKADFKYSFPTIQNVAQLKKAILFRYRQSMPELSEKEILSLGVAVTKIKVIGTLKKWVKRPG